jgi:hypothetical protein
VLRAARKLDESPTFALTPQKIRASKPEIARPIKYRIRTSPKIPTEKTLKAPNKEEVKD